MRKRIVSLGMCLALLAPFLGCKKKERLTAPTLLVRVSPTAANVVAGVQKTFTAQVVGPGGETLDAEPEWTLSSSALGTLSPQTGSQTTFTASSNLGTSGTLQVSYQGISSSAQIVVKPDTGNPATSYGFISEALPTGIRFDVANPPNPDGGFQGGFNGGGGTVLLSDARAAGTYSEGIKALKVAVSIPNALAYAGVYMQFGYDASTNPQQTRDLSAYAGGSLKFDLRAPANQEVYVKLEWDTPGPLHEYEIALRAQRGVVFDDTFRSISIPLSSFTGLDLSKLRVLVFAAKSPASGTYSFYLDNLRIEK